MTGPTACRSSSRFAESCNGNSHALVPYVISLRNIFNECAECTRLFSQYEVATFEQARIHNALGMVENLQDRLSTRLLKLEAYEVTARRNSVRSALMRHQDATHGYVHMTGIGSPTVASGKEA